MARCLQSTKFVCLITIIFLILCAGGIAVAEAPLREADLRISPAIAPPSTDVTVSGRGFGASEVVALSFDDEAAGTASTDSFGAFTTPIAIPPIAVPGVHSIGATGVSSGRTASRPLLVRTDWNKFRFDSGNTGVNPYENVLSPSNVSGLTLRWSYPTINGFTAPALSGGMAYVGTLYAVDAFDAATGSPVWSVYSRNQVTATPAVADGMVFVGSNDHWLYALSATTGARRWGYKTGAAIEGSVLVANGMVYICSDDGFVYALDARTGTLNWSSSVGVVQGSPVIAGGMLIVAGLRRHLYALDALTGAGEWAATLPGTTFASPVAADGMVFVSTSDGKMLALDAATGAREWSFDVGSSFYASPAVANGLVFFGSERGDLYALSESTGSIAWSFKDVLTVSIGQFPTLANGVLYVDVDLEGIYAFDPATGTLLGVIDPRSYNYAEPTISDGVLYIACHGGLFAYGLP
jgi:outer membrane protein assembly factor BamB